jgi:hypothetical protein
MFNIIRGPLAAALLLGVSLAATAPVSAAVVGVQLGGVGISVGNGHYYDRNHHVRSYSYPSDWKAYHHPQSWYRSHSSWNDANSRDYYRH